MEQESIQKLEQQIEDLAIAVKGGFDAVDQRFDNLEAKLQTQYPDKRYLDEKLADLAAEIGMRIMQRKERDNRFKLKIIDIFKRASLTTEDEVKFLENLID